MGTYGEFQRSIENIVNTLLVATGSKVAALYRLNSNGGYVPVLWTPCGVGREEPPHVSAASDLAAFLRSNRVEPFVMEQDSFKDGPVRRGFDAFGISCLVVMPLDREARGRYYLACGRIEGFDGKPPTVFGAFAERIMTALDEATLRARIRGSILPILDSRSEAVNESSSVLRLIGNAMEGCPLGTLVEEATGALGLPGSCITVEDTDGLILSTTEGNSTEPSSLDWLSGFSRLPYLDRLEETHLPVFVPLGIDPSSCGRLIIPLFGKRHLLGLVSVFPISRDEVNGKSDVFLGLRWAVQYVLRCREASRTHVLKRSLNSVENERVIISRLLHDETSQTLVALKVLLATAERALDRSALEDVRGIIEDCSRISDGILDGVNRLAANLRSSELSYLGLKPAIEAAAESKLVRPGIGFRLFGNATDVRFSALQENMLFKGVDEALANCAKHSHASSVEVEMFESGGWFTIAVRDNGDGFDVVARSLSSYGLKTMHDCAEAIGGSFWIGSESDAGTAVRFSVPIDLLEEVSDE